MNTEPLTFGLFGLGLTNVLMTFSNESGMGGKALGVGMLFGFATTLSFKSRYAIGPRRGSTLPCARCGGTCAPLQQSGGSCVRDRECDLMAPSRSQAKAAVASSPLPPGGGGTPV